MQRPLHPNQWRLFGSLRSRVILLVLLLAVATFLLVTVSFATRRDQSIALAQDDALRYAKLAASHYSQQVEAARQVLIALSAVPAVRNGDEPACSTYLAGLLPFYPNFTHIGVFDLNGNMICASEPAPPGVTYEDSPLYAPLLATRDFVIGGYMVGAVTQEQIIGTVYPIFDETARIIGAVGAALDLVWLEDWLGQLAMPPDTALFVTDASGRVIASNMPDFIPVGAPVHTDEIACFAEREICPDGMTRSDQVDGVTRLYGYTTLDNYPGAAYVSVGLSEPVVVGPLERAQQWYYVGIIVFSSVTMLIIVISAECLIVAPVHQLVRVTEQLARGDYAARRQRPRSVDEIDQLGGTMDRLARALEAREREVEQHTHELQQRIEQHQRTQTKLREAIQMLTQETEARYAAQQADELKRRFLAMVSHELRTPLTSIKGYASSLLADDVQWDSQQQNEFLQIIDEESDNLLDMVEQLLDLSQIDAGTLRIHPEPTTACAVLDRASYTLATLTPLHPLKIMCDPARQPTIQVDTMRVIQVLRNLVSNATRYTPPGTPVVVQAVPLDADSGSGSGGVQFSVRDYGPGIPPEQRAHLFQPFNRLKNGEQTTGIGMGLAICRGIVEAHGGQIAVKDPESGKGICFEFTLPRQPDPRHVGAVDVVELDR